VNETVDSKMAANELVREGVVICDYLIKECQHILEKRNKRKKRRWVKPWIMRRNILGASNTLLVELTSEDRDIQGVPGGICQTSGGCSLC
jgi:hypothetical protein